MEFTHFVSLKLVQKAKHKVAEVHLTETFN